MKYDGTAIVFTADEGNYYKLKTVQMCVGTYVCTPFSFTIKYGLGADIKAKSSQSYDGRNVTTRNIKNKK